MKILEKIQKFLTLIALVVSIFAVVWSASSNHARASAIQEAHSAEIEDHKKRIQTLEHSVTNVAADVRWIREYLSKGVPNE